jgi:SAM-dependent methyltransferase
MNGNSFRLGRIPEGSHAMNQYDGVDIHHLLVTDEVRTRAFCESIQATVKPGAIVLDAGAGSGILSLFAAQIGAARVYAVERAPGAAALARRIVALNGVAETVTVVEADAATAILPEKVDVIVSEWLGVYGVDENMLAPVLIARDRWLKPGGVMIPSRVTAWIAPVSHEAAQQAIALHTRPYGFDLSPLAAFSLDQAIWLPKGLREDQLRGEPQRLWVTDCATTPALEASRPHAAELRFRLNGSGVNGVVTWFSAEMPGAGVLCTGPGEPATHWGQLLFPIANAHRLTEGDELAVGFHNVPGGLFGSHHIWASQIDGEAREVHDTRRHPRANMDPPWRAFVDAVESK